ncbi:MAG TPA: nucleoside hydrolase-like domain-containing protein, partial [Sphingomonas sp.]|nr:nucleoside hydrolase-like domain-containing protein [Sphingomonas sp.]
MLPFALLLLSAQAAPAISPPIAERPRIIVLSDIGNEPDDSESLVRFLLYADCFDVEGLVATTSVWQRDKVQPQLMRARIDAYAQVRPNLLRHSPTYPTADALRAVLRSGQPAYGMAGV